MDMGGGGGGGVFGYYKKYLGYKNLKAQEHSERTGLENNLNQANNNLQITQQQAPLVPQQAAEGFAARGVGQSTFGAGMGDQWNQNPGSAPNLLPNGAPAPQAPPPGGADQYRAIHPDPSWAPTSGQGQPVGTGLQRARDLSSAMVSNATSGQKAAQDALDQYKKTIKNNRHMFYNDVAQAWIGMVMGTMM